MSRPVGDFAVKPSWFDRCPFHRKPLVMGLPDPSAGGTWTSPFGASESVQERLLRGHRGPTLDTLPQTEGQCNQSGFEDAWPHPHMPSCETLKGQHLVQHALWGLPFTSSAGQGGRCQNKPVRCSRRYKTCHFGCRIYKAGSGTGQGGNPDQHAAQSTQQMQQP